MNSSMIRCLHTYWKDLYAQNGASIVQITLGENKGSIKIEEIFTWYESYSTNKPSSHKKIERLKATCKNYLRELVQSFLLASFSLNSVKYVSSCRNMVSAVANTLRRKDKITSAATFDPTKTIQDMFVLNMISANTRSIPIYKEGSWIVSRTR